MPVLRFTNYLGLSANSNTRLPVTQPLWQGDTFLAAHQSWFKKESAWGKPLLSTKELGKNFTLLFSGPIQCKEVIDLPEIQGLPDNCGLTRFLDPDS